MRLRSGEQSPWGAVPFAGIRLFRSERLSGSGPGRRCHTGLVAAPCECSVLRGCFFFSKLNKLEQLEELNLSGNKLKTIPTTIANCKRLHTLVAHSNNISIFPEILQLPQIQVLFCDGAVSCWGNGRSLSSRRGEESGSLGSQQI